MWDALFPYVVALLPTVAVGTLFYFLIKAILEGDRRERLAQSKWEAAQRRTDTGNIEENSQKTTE
jgi:hypothetical protein